MPIFTEYHGPEALRGSTIRAWHVQPNSPYRSEIWIDYDPALTSEQNHFDASQRLAMALGLTAYSNREQLAANLYRYDTDEEEG